MNLPDFTSRTEQLKTKLYRTALLYVGDEITALEMVDETVYHGLKGLAKLREPDFFETWMMRILINNCKQALRKRKREIPIETLPEEAAEQFDALPLKDAILRLPPELKEVVILRFLSDYTLKETAETLAIPQGTVVTRQRKALQLLRLELEEEA